LSKSAKPPPATRDTDATDTFRICLGIILDFGSIQFLRDTDVKYQLPSINIGGIEYWILHLLFTVYDEGILFIVHSSAT
jgi:hypothetical protein